MNPEPSAQELEDDSLPTGADPAPVPFALPTIEQLAANPPPRKIYCIAIPTEAECIKALEMQPSGSKDSWRLVWIAAKLANDGGKMLDRLAFSYLFVGHEWPIPVRAAVLASCPWALHLERRLAAIEAYRAAQRKDKAPPPILSVL